MAGKAMKQERYIPLEKMSRKKQREYYAARRADWNGVVPVTRQIPNKKKQCDARGRIRAHEEETD